MNGRLTARSTVRQWLDDPMGNDLLSELLARVGQDASQLGPAGVFPLESLAALSGGRLGQEDVENLVRRANGGVLVEEDPADPTATSPVAVRSGLRLDEIHIRDPYIVQDASTYWLFGSTDENIWFGAGTGFDTYRSDDLQSWEGPFQAFRRPAGFWSEGMFWAPEVHRHRDRWFMFATFTGPDGHRGTQILAADEVRGPFEPWSDGPVTPRKWRCLDGTFFVDDAGDPWIVYCHEWTQIHDGAIMAQRLSDDLRRTVGTPLYLFSASDAAWSKPMTGPGFEQYELPVHVTDGPSLYRLPSGRLLMLWSSFGVQGYAMGVAWSESGSVTGPWIQQSEPLWVTDGGHGMIFRLPDGEPALTLHQPNTTPDERAIICRLVEDVDTVRLVDTH